MSSDDYVQYLTKRFVKYLDTPREERKKQRQNKQRERWDRHLFGDLSFSVRMYWQNRKQRHKHKRAR